MISRLLRVVVIVMFISVSTVLLNGCSSKTDTMPPADLAPLASSVGGFEDIELPSEMKLNNKETTSIITESFRGGKFVYSGRVEVQSLKAYLVATMKNNKWKHVYEGSSNEIMLAFMKPNKTCLVSISEKFGGMGSTNLTMYVTVDVSAASRLNPFGEPVTN